MSGYDRATFLLEGELHKVFSNAMDAGLTAGTIVDELRDFADNISLFLKEAPAILARYDAAPPPKARRKASTSRRPS